MPDPIIDIQHAYVTHKDLELFRQEVRDDIRELSNQFAAFGDKVMGELAHRGRINWSAVSVLLVIAGMAAALIVSLTDGIVNRQEEINLRLDRAVMQNSQAVITMDTIMQREMRLLDEVLQREIRLNIERLDDLIDVNVRRLEEVESRERLR